MDFDQDSMEAALGIGHDEPITASAPASGGDSGGGFLENAWNTVSDGASAAWDSASTGASNAWNTVSDGVASAEQTVSDTASGAWNAVSDTASNVAGSVESGASGAWDAVTGGIASAGKTVADGASSAWDWAANKADNLVNGTPEERAQAEQDKIKADNKAYLAELQKQPNLTPEVLKKQNDDDRRQRDQPRVLAQISQREAEFDKSGRSPAERRDFCKKWDHEHGLDEPVQ